MATPTSYALDLGKVEVDDGIPGLRWGIMSTAHITQKVVRAIKCARGSKVIAVASRTLEKATKHAHDLDIPKAFGTYEELLEMKEIDAVYCPLPTALRKEWVIRIAHAGKHVLCEKPTAKNADDLREMLAACRKANVQFMDGTMWVHGERAREMHKLLYEEKVLGNIISAVSAFTFMMDAAEFARNIRTKESLEPLGALGDAGWYCIRWTLWAFNWDMPTHAIASCHRLENGVPTHITGSLEFSDGRSAMIECDFRSALRQWAEVVGEKGTMSVDDLVISATDRARYTIETEAKFDEKLEHFTARLEERSVMGSNPQVAMIEDFAVASVKHDNIWPEYTLKTQIVLDAVMQAATTGTRVAVAAL